jgi:hypothetical protein
VIYVVPGDSANGGEFIQPRCWHLLFQCVKKEPDRDFTHSRTLRIPTDPCAAICGAARTSTSASHSWRGWRPFFHELEEYNADFAALEEIDKSRQLFSPAEVEELRHLLGLHGVELEKRLPAGRATAAHASERQQAWSEVCLRARDSVRRRVAERAQARYGLILYDLTGTGG